MSCLLSRTVHHHTRLISYSPCLLGSALTFLSTPCREAPAPSATPTSPKITTLASKRTNQRSTDARWSVIAYNLSEELMIENTQKLLDRFQEYQAIQVPADLKGEVMMLSRKGNTPESERKPGDHKEPLQDVFLFREGSIVFWGVPYDQQRSILYALTPLRVDPYSSDLIQDEREHLNYELVPSLERSRLKRETLQIAIDRDSNDLLLDKFALSHAVALSVKLGIWESVLDRYIDSVSWIAHSMKSGKNVRLTRDEVFRKIGELFELKHRLNLSSDLLDLPDVYWDRHDQEVLFSSMISFLNIRKRTSVMNEKLNNCCELMNLLSAHINDRHHIRLEWMIIALISIEVLFEIVRLF